MTDTSAEAPSEGAGTNAGVGAAALIATFYAARDAPALALLHEQLWRALAEPPPTATVPDNWEVPERGAFGRRSDPAGAPEASVVQLGLDAPGVAAEACETARQRLVEVLPPESLESLWGYSLIYEATLAEGADPEAGLRTLLPATRRLDGALARQPLASARWAGGHLWLLDIPISGAGLAAAAVYAALSAPAIEDAFLKRAVYGEEAELLLPDLVAHEGYFEARQVRLDGLEQLYERRVDALRTATTSLLDELRANHAIGDDLDRLSATYDRLSRVVPEFARVRNTLRRLLHNYGVWEARLEANPILTFHRRHLETAITELDLVLERVRDALEGARTAVAVAQVETERAAAAAQAQAERAAAAAQEREERIEAEQQQFVQILLAVLAVLAVVPQLIDAETAAQLLQLAHLPVPTGDYRLATLLAVRIAFAVPFLLIAVPLVRVWGARRRKQALRRP